MDLERSAFALRHLYVYPRLRLAYTYIPKNACTAFKLTFGCAQGWLAAADGRTAHEMRFGWWLPGLLRYPDTEERVVVIRDPLDRVLSAYLDRFLMRADPAVDHAMKTGLAKIVGSEKTRAEVTFADFVEYLSRTPNRRLNEHWRPQADFLLGTYTRMIPFSQIQEDTAFLSRHGLSLAQVSGHATTAIRSDLGPGWGYRKAARLRRLRRRRGVLPTRTNMYDDTLRDLVADRYADDVALLSVLRANGSRLEGRHRC